MTLYDDASIATTNSIVDRHTPTSTATSTATTSNTTPITHTVVTSMAALVTTQPPLMSLTNFQQAARKKQRGPAFNSFEDQLLRELAEQWWVGLHISAHNKWVRISDEWNKRRINQRRSSSPAGSIEERSSEQLKGRYNDNLKNK